MASRQEIVQYIADQMAGAGNITYRKIFGEYGIYCDGKIFGVICDNQLFVKVTEAGKDLDLPLASPYEGAKPHFLVEDIDNRQFLAEFVRKTCDELPNKTKARKK